MTNSEERGAAETELDRIAERDRSRFFGVFKVEGTIAFSMGVNPVNRNGKGEGKKKAKRTLVIEELQEGGRFFC